VGGEFCGWGDGCDVSIIGHFPDIYISLMSIVIPESGNKSMKTKESRRNRTEGMG
jgi:hypothetical protein